MSSGSIKPAQASKPGQGGFAGLTPSNQSLLLEKLNVRRSTPDSEALASSDDEVDPHRQDTVTSATQTQRPVRRASWLTDSPQAANNPRKASFASSSMSPTTSHPGTPSVESGVGHWGSHSATMGRAHVGTSSFPWGTGIWNNERKEPPHRLSEVLPSPTSSLPPGSASNSLFGVDTGLSQSPVAREQGPTSQIPFAIPLHPTPKTYRSQSYSVGQLETEATSASNMNNMNPATAMGARNRSMVHPGLQHRPSRPSMLSEMSNDGAMLGKVNEVEDNDDESPNGSSHGLPQQSAEAKIEMLTRENAMLRQQQYHNARLRPRASTAASYGLGNGYGLHESVPEESEYAIDEFDESNDSSDIALRRNAGRRMSEFGLSGPYRSPYPVENRKLENVKKAYWQSSLGFGGLSDIPQSRRHSFADAHVPTRQGSIGSIGESMLSHEQASQDSHDYTNAYADSSPNFVTNSPTSYFGTSGGVSGSQALHHSAYGNQFTSPYTIHPSYSNRSTSPHRSLYGMAQPRHNQLLHIVLFKCARADVFYIQEGTGLTVKPGDLVIVEADRGTDLGTVAKGNVDWQTAKDLKEHYAEEQYRWLMMYSQNATAGQDGSTGGLMLASNAMQGSAIGGMGPPGQHHVQEPNSGELKPKLIKRLAQSHEIHALRDKEGNEAKAKRVCMQKVKEHGLNMEILDAEFQMDWKKLTFYYFADAYINFNSLVTDLFKIYKTRIWMSAINPASFASPTLGLQAPSGIGPGAVGVGRGGGNNERRQPQQQEQQQTQFQSTSPANRNFQSSFQQPFAGDRAGGPSGTTSAYPPNYPYGPYSAFGNVSRTGSGPYVSGMLQSLDTYQPFSQAVDYQSMRGQYSSPQSGGAPTSHDQSVSPLATQSEWVGGLQGLSLNSR